LRRLHADAIFFSRGENKIKQAKPEGLAENTIKLSLELDGTLKFGLSLFSASDKP